MSNLADCYLNGRGVDKNHKTAVQWYEKSAGRENSSGMSGLAWCYEWGYGVEQNAAKAVEWYEKASKRGSTTAKRALERADLIEAACLALARPAPPTAAVASASSLQQRADATSLGDASSSALTASVSYIQAAPGHPLQHLGQGGDGFARSRQPQPRELGGGAPGHPAVRAGHPFQPVVVEHHGLAVGGALHVQLHAVAGVRGGGEGGQAVLGRAPRRPQAAVRYGRGGQASPGARVHAGGGGVGHAVSTTASTSTAKLRGRR